METEAEDETEEVAAVVKVPGKCNDTTT